MSILPSPGMKRTSPPIHAMRYRNIEHPGFSAIYAGTDNDFHNKYYWMEGWKLVQYYSIAPVPIQEAYQAAHSGSLWMEETAPGTSDYVPAIVPRQLGEFTDEQIVRDRYLIDGTTGRSMLIINVVDAPPKHLHRYYMFMERSIATTEERKLFMDNEFQPVVIEYQKRDVNWLLPG